MEEKTEIKKVTKPYKPKTFSVRIKKNVISEERIFSVKHNPITVTFKEKSFLKENGAL